MARLLSQTLIQTITPQTSIKLTTISHHHTRLFSSKSQLIEVDLDSDALPKLEDVIHSIIVKQSAPDWLPFLPGSSYWVPPRRHRHRHDPQGIVSLLRRFTKPLTDEESMALSSARGWPSSAYFIEGTSTIHPVPIEMEPEVVNINDENTSDAKNKEG